MALVGAECSAWKSQRAIANTWAQSRGALLILSLLLYFICPVSAIAAPRHHFRGPPFSNSTIARLPKWHTRFIANSSLSTWGSAFTSGSRLVTMFPVDTALGRPSSSQFQGFIVASHRPHNIAAVPSTANVTYRRNSTTSISPSPSRHLQLSDQEAAMTSHSTNISTSVTHRRNSTISSSSSPSRYLRLSDQEATKTRHSRNVASRSIRLWNNSTQANHRPSSSDYLVSNISRLSSLSRNTTRANDDITSADVSLAKTSSSYPSFSSFTLPSSSSSSSYAPMTPLHPGSFPKLSGSSSLSSTTRRSMTPSQSSLASVTPKPSTPAPSVTPGPSLSSSKLPFSLPPGCKLTVFRNETYVLIPTERARMIHKQLPSTMSQAGAVGYDPGPSSSNTSQAGADRYDTPNPPKPEDPFDKQVVKNSPSSRTASIILGSVLGIFPTVLAIPFTWYKWREWRLQVDEREGRIRKRPRNPAEEAQDIYDTVKKGKWTERVALWLKDLNEWDPKPKPTGHAWPSGAQKLMQMLEVSLHSRKLL